MPFCFCFGEDDQQMCEGTVVGTKLNGLLPYVRRPESATSYNARSPLVLISGMLTAQCCANKVLKPLSIPFLNAQYAVIFQQDNTRPHTDAISRACLKDTDATLCNG